MFVRPIDVARKLGVSTTTLRKYEELGLIPPVTRSQAGYRLYTEEHAAYFICIREMLPGFKLTRILKILREVMAKNINTALWMVNLDQAGLHREKQVYEHIIRKLVRRKKRSFNRLLTISEVSRKTGVPATTIRHWDNVGLISSKRCVENGYRLFTAEHIQQILMIYALKTALYSKRHKYSIKKIKKELKQFDCNDRNRIITIARDMKNYLAQVNRAQIKGISALYHLCNQVEANRFDQVLWQKNKKA